MLPTSQCHNVTDVTMSQCYQRHNVTMLLTLAYARYPGVSDSN